MDPSAKEKMTSYNQYSHYTLLCASLNYSTLLVQMFHMGRLPMCYKMYQAHSVNVRFHQQDIDHMMNEMADKEIPNNAALLTQNTLADIFANNKKGYHLLNPMESDPAKWVDSILGNIDMTDAPADLREQMEDVLPKLKDIFIEYIVIIREARKRIA